MAINSYYNPRPYQCFMAYDIMIGGKRYLSGFLTHNSYSFNLSECVKDCVEAALLRHQEAANATCNVTSFYREYMSGC
jgi:hypothetical protein